MIGFKSGRNHGHDDAKQHLPRQRRARSPSAGRRRHALPSRDHRLISAAIVYIRYIYPGEENIDTAHLLLKFRSRDTRSGVTRATVKSLAAELDVSETQVVHLALSKLAEEVLPAYERDEATLTSAEVSAVRKRAKAAMPMGKILDKQSLF